MGMKPPYTSRQGQFLAFIPITRPCTDARPQGRRWRGSFKVTPPILSSFTFRIHGIHGVFINVRPFSTITLVEPLV